MNANTTEGVVLSTLVEMKQAHRRYIRDELKKRGLGFVGLLVRYGMADADEPTEADGKYLAIFNRFLSCDNALGGDKGAKIKAALLEEGVDLSASPTFPLTHDASTIRAAS